MTDADSFIKELKYIFWAIWLVLVLAALAHCQTVPASEIRMTGTPANYAPLAGRYRMGINTTTNKYFCVTPTGGDCMPTSVPAIGTTVQVNGTNVTTQSPINFTGAGQITISNPSAGNVQIGMTGSFAASGANNDITNLTGLATTNLSTTGIAIGTTGSNGIWFSDTNHINLAPGGNDLVTMVGSSNLFRFRSATVLGWNAALTATGGSMDTGLSRVGLNIIGAGNGTQGDISGTFEALLVCLDNAGHCWKANPGSPEGTITSPPGAIVSDTTNGALYVKTATGGTAATGYQQLGSGGTTTPTSTAVFMNANSAASTSTTMANLTNLSFTLTASTNYQIRCQLFYQVSASTGGLVLQFTGPSAPTSLLLGSRQMISTTSVRNDSISAYVSKFNPSNILTTATTTNLLVTIDGIIENGVNSGTLQLQYANAAAAAGSVTVMRDSMCRAQVI